MGRRGLLRLARAQMADWARPGWFGPVSPISFFFLSYFLFSISFIYFAKQIQNTSNQFVIFSKIQLNILGQ
jgi:hypothetical protein